MDVALLLCNHFVSKEVYLMMKTRREVNLQQIKYALSRLGIIVCPMRTQNQISKPRKEIRAHSANSNFLKARDALLVMSFPLFMSSVPLAASLRAQSALLEASRVSTRKAAPLLIVLLIGDDLKHIPIADSGSNAAKALIDGHVLHGALLLEAVQG